MSTPEKKSESAQELLKEGIKKSKEQSNIIYIAALVLQNYFDSITKLQFTFL